MADKGRVELVAVGGGVVGKATFEPGWRWSEHVKPGHDGWAMGDEPCVVIDFAGMEHYAKSG